MRDGSKEPREIDPAEIEEWADSLDAVIDRHGLRAASRLLQGLTRRATLQGVDLPFTANTPYINTVSPEEETQYPGDRDIEAQIKSLVRWNALAMVVRANQREGGRSHMVNATTPLVSQMVSSSQEFVEAGH